MKPPHSVPAEQSESVIAETKVVETSALAKRLQMSPKQARVYAGLWFSAFGALAGFLCGVVVFLFSMMSGMSAAPMLGFSIFGALMSFVPGAHYGSKILLRKDGGKPSWRGTEVVLGANLTMGIAAGVIYAIGLVLSTGLRGLPMGLLFAAIGAVFFALMSFMVTGIITIPLGMTAGVLLARRRDKGFGARGCAVHGYREGGAE